jgi:hypothetical protein
MNVSEKTRARIIKEHRSGVAKKSASTLLSRDPDHFRKIGGKGGRRGKGKPKRRAV